VYNGLILRVIVVPQLILLCISIVKITALKFTKKLFVERQVHLQCAHGCVHSYNLHYASWGVYIPKVDLVGYSVNALGVLNVCPGSWFRSVALNFGLMKTVNSAVDYG